METTTLKIGDTIKLNHTAQPWTRAFEWFEVREVASWGVKCYTRTEAGEAHYRAEWSEIKGHENEGGAA